MQPSAPQMVSDIEGQSSSLARVLQQPCGAGRAQLLEAAALLRSSARSVVVGVLINMIAGFIRPDTGAVVIDGVPRSKPDPKGILITQHGAVFPWRTVREHLMFASSGRRRTTKRRSPTATPPSSVS